LQSKPNYGLKDGLLKIFSNVTTSCMLLCVGVLKFIVLFFFLTEILTEEVTYGFPYLLFSLHLPEGSQSSHVPLLADKIWTSETIFIKFLIIPQNF
jgi:hypothetical protein